MVRNRCVLAGVVLHLGLALATANAQSARSRVDVTSLAPDAALAYRTWDSYLQSKAGKLSSAAGNPSPHWSEAEQRRWPVYDLAAFYLLDDAVPEILAINRAVDPGVDAFRITTRVSRERPIRANDVVV